MEDDLTTNQITNKKPTVKRGRKRKASASVRSRKDDVKNEKQQKVTDVASSQEEEELTVEFDVKRTITVNPTMVKTTRRTRRAQKSNI